MYTINQLVEYVRGQAARGRRSFALVAENGDIFQVDRVESEFEEGYRVRKDGSAFGIMLLDSDPMEGYSGHDPGDEYQI